jgi:hypothetical protein
VIDGLVADLSGLRRQLWLEHAAHAARLGLAIGAALLVFAEVAARLTLAVPTASLAIVPPASLALALGWILLRRPTPAEAARAADARLGLREQLGTAVELGHQDAPSPLALAQIARARLVAQQASPLARRAIAGSLTRIVAACGVAVALAGLVVVTDGSLAAWRRSERPADTIQPATRADVNEPVPNVPTIAGLGRLATLMQPVSQSQPPSEEQLATVQQELGQATARSQAAQQSLATLAAALRQVSAGEAAAQALENGDYPAAVAAIVALGQNSDQLSAEARRDLSAALVAAAQASPDAPLLADREHRAAEALNFPSYAPTVGALRDLAQATDRASQAILTQSELSAAWQQLSNTARLSNTGPARPGVGALAGQADTAAAGTGAASAAPPPGDAANTRLETAGVPVEVPLSASATRGSPSIAQGGAPPADRLQVVAEPADASGQGARGPAQVARAERNTIPDDRRAMVRDYFIDPGRSP